MSWLVGGVENPTPEEIEKYFMENKKHIVIIDDEQDILELNLLPKLILK